MIDKALRIAGRLVALVLSSMLATLIALNCKAAFPSEVQFITMLQGGVNLWLLMLWFPSMRWERGDA